MFAAIYARRSNEQHVSEDAKSITRQVTRAREMAAKEGWECPDQYVFVDDGISGFESGLRPGLRRLLAACPPKAGERSFDLVIVSEQSRLVRNTFEAGPIFDAFLRADIRVFSYLNGEIRFRTIPEKMMVMMGAGMDEAPVSQTRSRTTDAMLLKARRGHVTGGKVFGYENVVIRGPDGRKSHVDRRILHEQAAVVRRIFQMSARGIGYRAIAAALNAEGAPAPRPQQNRPEGWADSSVREVLYRDLYRGNSVYNKKRKKTSAGYKGRSSRPESEWIRVPKPEWRIVDDDLWAAAHAHLNQQRERYPRQPGAVQRPNVKDSKYLLTGFCACGECGAGLYVKTCAHGSRGRRFRVPFLHCVASNRGTVCTTWRKVRHDVASEYILRELKHLLNQPTFIEATVQYLSDLGWLAQRDDAFERRSELRKQVGVLGKEIQNLTDALAEGRAVKSVFVALQEREQEQEALQRELDRLTSTAQVRSTNLSKISDKVRARFGELLDQLSYHSDVARDVLRTVLAKRIVFKPEPEAKIVRFFGELNIGRLFGVVPLERVETPTLLASPPGFEPGFWP